MNFVGCLLLTIIHEKRDASIVSIKIPESHQHRRHPFLVPVWSDPLLYLPLYHSFQSSSAPSRAVTRWYYQHPPRHSAVVRPASRADLLPPQRVTHRDCRRSIRPCQTADPATVCATPSHAEKHPTARSIGDRAVPLPPGATPIG